MPATVTRMLSTPKMTEDKRLVIEKFSCHQQPRWFKLSERFFYLWQKGGNSVPKRVGLISFLFLFNFINIPKVNAQVLLLHTVQLDAA